MRFQGLVFALSLAAATTSSWERLRIDRDGDERVVDAQVVVEALDGGLLLQHADQRLELAPAAVIRGRQPLAGVPEAPSVQTLAADVLRTLPAGFDHLATRHYVVCFDTSRAYAQWCGALFERLHDTFTRFWQRTGLDIREPEHPLVVVIFADRRRYEETAAQDLGSATDRVVGYYNLLSNRVTTFDLTGSDLLAGRPGRSVARAGLEILSSREASGLVATLVHEATHQMAFNCGLHRRLAPVPLWVSEGIALYFETPDPSSDRGWRGLGAVNSTRRDRFVASGRPGWLGKIVRSDEAFRDADEALDAYAGAWAATAYLIQARRDAYLEYMRAMSLKEPLVEESADQREAEFVSAFGGAPKTIEESIARFVARLR